MKTLKERWAGLWTRMGCKTGAERQFKGLLNRYAEPGRAHHTISHIESSLDELEAVRSICCNPDAVEAAIWYHDAVYDSKAKNNELQSAHLFRVDAAEILNYRNYAFIGGVNRMIIATRHLRTKEADLDTLLLLDIDPLTLQRAPRTPWNRGRSSKYLPASLLRSWRRPISGQPPGPEKTRPAAPT